METIGTSSIYGGVNLVLFAHLIVSVFFLYYVTIGGCFFLANAFPAKTVLCTNHDFEGVKECTFWTDRTSMAWIPSVHNSERKKKTGTHYIFDRLDEFALNSCKSIRHICSILIKLGEHEKRKKGENRGDVEINFCLVILALAMSCGIGRPGWLAAFRSTWSHKDQIRQHSCFKSWECNFWTQTYRFKELRVSGSRQVLNLLHSKFIS